jgi:hypothetical protein
MLLRAQCAEFGVEESRARADDAGPDLSQLLGPPPDRDLRRRALILLSPGYERVVF